MGCVSCKGHENSQALPTSKSCATPVSRQYTNDRSNRGKGKKTHENESQSLKRSLDLRRHGGNAALVELKNARDGPSTGSTCASSCIETGCASSGSEVLISKPDIKSASRITSSPIIRVARTNN
uniref:Uncharacterized protein n=1 Tax=Tetraselmis sp. GSL018 TaxID=582737 RepID=A0A061S6F8_9CHLO